MAGTLHQFALAAATFPSYVSIRRNGMDYMQVLTFEYYTRKPEFLTKDKSFEAIYLLPERAPEGFMRSQWNFKGFARAPRSATIAEVRKGQLYRDCPANIDAHALWPNL
jgi:hypothetical protein